MGGGVAVLIKQSTTAVIWEDVEGLPNKAIWVKFRNSKGEVTFMGLYNRPSNSQQVLEELNGS